jgi:hypothetical protein
MEAIGVSTVVVPTYQTTRCHSARDDITQVQYPGNLNRNRQANTKNVTAFFFLARSQNCEKRLLVSSCLSVCLSVRMEQFGSHLTEFHLNLTYEDFSKICLNIQASLKSEKLTGTIHEERDTLTIISRPVLRIMRNISDRSCTENQNTHFIFRNNFFFRKSCRGQYLTT